MKIRLFIAFAFFNSLNAMAQQPLTIKLQEAIEMGLNNSAKAKLDNATIEIATAKLKQALEKRLPDASVGGSYMALTTPNITMHTGKDSASGGASNLKINQVAYGMLNISYPIYAGNRIKYGIEAAKLLEKATKLDAENNKQEIAFNIVEAYTTLLKANTTVSIVKENLTQAQQRVKDFTNLEKNGIIARNDLMKAELQASQAELALFDAENNSKLANVSLALLLGISTNTQINVDTSFVNANTVDTYEMYEQQALQNRKDISALATRKQANEVNIKAIKGNYYPSIALTGGYVGAYIPNFLTVTNAANIGIGIKYDIGSLWKTKSKIAEAQAQQKQITANESLLNDAIRLQTYSAYENYILSNRKIAVLEKAIAQSAENYRITKNKYDNSLATTTDLLDADIAQLQAKLNMANAKADIITAFYKLQEVTGTLIK